MLTLDWPQARAIAQVLSVVLEETPFILRPSETAQPEVSQEELKSVIELQAKSIREFANDLEATRRRAEAAEAKLVEMKRGG